MAYRLPGFNHFFQEKHVSVPSEKGDGIFFNSALFHAAGENITAGTEPSANLLQVSSTFGKPMEATDSVPLISRCCEGLMQKYNWERMSNGVQTILGAIAEGYPFPTKLDKRPPAPGGMAPESEQDTILQKSMEHGGCDGNTGTDESRFCLASASPVIPCVETDEHTIFRNSNTTCNRLIRV